LTNNFVFQASSDLSVLDFDIPFAFIFVAAPLTELLATIGIMASVTWQVLIVAILAMAASKYVQVKHNFHMATFNLFFFYLDGELIASYLLFLLKRDII
jgi:hypothetical protein